MGLGACRCSRTLPAHKQLLWREPTGNQPQPLLSSQTLQDPEEQSKVRASLEQPAGGKGQAVSLTYLLGRLRARRSDRHQAQIFSNAVAAALGAPVPGDRAKARIKQFTAPTGPEFNGTEKVLTNQVPWQGPSSSACCPSHTTTALVPPALLNLRWTQMERPHPASWLPDHKDPKVKEKVPDMPVLPRLPPPPPLREVSTVLQA